MPVFNSKTVKIKKPRKCFACLRKSEIGESMVYTTGVVDGDFFALYTCLTCDEILSLSKQDEPFQEGYVNDCLDKNQTPEQYLETLK
jgi:hypothetical protein